MLVGLSGGVDSAVAALVLLEAGYRVHGVTFSLWTDSSLSAENRCCSAHALGSARQTAERLGIPHDVVDLADPFYRVVVEPFVATYAGGMTPNPCVACNARLRMPMLFRLAGQWGLDGIATGHYARLVGVPPRLHRARAEDKDQSYVLARVDPQVLESAHFPLGELDKAEVRARAKRAGLEVHGRAESQEICFIPDNDHRRFLSERLEHRPGPICDLNGRQIGHHAGIHRFTIGQRKGLGIAAAQPLYVVAIRGQDNAVIVGPAAVLEVRELEVRDITWHEPALLEQPLRVQIRSTGRPVAAEVLAWEGDGLRLGLRGSERAAAPGQTAVIYHGDQVVCGGVIVSSWSGLRPS